MPLLEKIPKLQKLSPVYSVAALIIYTWTILWFFWKSSGWLVYLRISEIFTILAYSISINFLESLFVLSALILVSLLLPQSWFYDQFVVRGTALTLLGLSYTVYIASLIQDRSDFPRSHILRISIPVFIAILVLVYFSTKVEFIRNLLEEIANRSVIFLYIILPASIVSLLIVLFRNLF